MAAGKVRLKSQTQFYLEIKSNGMVVGSEDDSPDSILRLSGPPEQIRIQNVHNGLYLCFNATGRLYGERSMEHEGTLFKEISYNNLYLNYKAVDKDWYVSIRRDGILRSGPRSFNTEKNSRIEEREFLKLTIE